MELSAYFTHCNLQPAHLALALNLAMSQSFRGGNYIHAASYARRILELPDVAMAKADLRSKAAVVLKKSEENARNEQRLNFDERNPYVLDCAELVPIYKGTPLVTCAFCGSNYKACMKGAICVTCRLSVIGVETLGLVTQSQTKRQ
mmetsp:Transcript_10077/g.32862  ORF Transcript_10077/g.32862 Transcript_10077/m.32862 type:complete len:146 (+) Transcript_10077:3451-3888(+)